MAEFAPAYQIVRANEGGYANHPADAGGETYAGIARNYWPNWGGWHIVDMYKSAPFTAEIQTGAKIPNTEEAVQQFYHDRWNDARAGEINSQAVANIYFDFYILHSQAVRAMQEVLNDLGVPVAIDNVIGPQTLSAINSIDPEILHDAYKAKRIDIHMQRVEDRPDQLVFLEGWVKRANMFPTLTGSGKIMVGLAVIGVIVLVYSLTQKQKKKK